jgi:site-specific recombinase XerD
MAHALRHTYGMDLAMRGVPLSVIQQLLGHDDPRTTSIYTVAHAEDLSAALADAGAL